MEASFLAKLKKPHRTQNRPTFTPLEQGRIPRSADMPGLLRLIFAASPLSRVMLRHTRPLLEMYRDQGQLGTTLAQRQILRIPRIDFHELERQA